MKNKKTHSLAMSQTDYNATVHFMTQSPYQRMTKKDAQAQLDELISEAASGERHYMKAASGKKDKSQRQYSTMVGFGGVEVVILWHGRKSREGYLQFQVAPTWKLDPSGEPAIWQPKAA